uniref:Choline transporter-like protein n=1 Tax=Heterorhabditis bacteriophora TaxID=37862 RepID=A0A1I7WWW9_HETBA
MCYLTSCCYEEESVNFGAVFNKRSLKTVLIIRRKILRDFRIFGSLSLIIVILYNAFYLIIQKIITALLGILLVILSYYFFHYLFLGYYIIQIYIYIYISVLNIRKLAVENNNTLCADYQAALNIENMTNTFGLCPRLPVIEIDVIRGFLYDIIAISPVILKMSFISLALSLIAIVLLQFFVVMIIYTIYILVVVFATGISSGLWYAVYTNSFTETKNITSMEVENELNDLVQPVQVQIAAIFTEINSESWFKLEKIGNFTLLGIALGATVITGSISVIVWCLFPRVKNVVKFFRCASKALSAMPLLLFQPAITSFFVVIIGIYSLSIGLILYTAGLFLKLVYISSKRVYISIKIFQYLIFFRLLLQIMPVGYLKSIYLKNTSITCTFFILESHSLPPRISCFWIFYNHISKSTTLHTNVDIHKVGDLFPIFQVILIGIFFRMKAVKNPVLRKILASFICILGCIESCLRYINYNVFTVISYSGLSFCSAAKIAVSRLLDNAVNVATVNTVGDSVLFLTKCIIATITTGISFISMQNLPSLFHPWFPLVIIFIISYQIANCFLSIYEMTVDTIMLCWAEEIASMRENPEAIQECRECMHDDCDESMHTLPYIGHSEPSQSLEDVSST